MAPFPVRTIRSDIEPGQRVEQGQTLAVIDAPMLADRVARFDAQRRLVALAAKALDDTRARLDQRLTTNEDVIRSESALNATRADADDAFGRLVQSLVSLGQDVSRQRVVELLDEGSMRNVVASFSVVKAPFAGVVMERHALAGVTSPAGEVLYAIEDVSGINVDVGVPPGEVSDWQGGDATVRLLGQDLALEPAGSVPRLDPDTGLMLLRYRGVVPAERQVDGAWVPATLGGGQRPVVWVPRSAVVARNGATWCLVSDEENTPTPVRVTVGPEQDGRIPILSGVRAGQRVLVRNAYEVLYRDLSDLITFED